MKKIIFTTLLLVLSVATSTFTYAEDYTEEYDIYEDMSEGLNEDLSSIPENNIDWNNITFSIANVNYTFPVSYETLSSNGWILNEMPFEINSLEYEFVNMINPTYPNHNAIFVCANQSLNKAGIGSCSVVGAGMEAESFDFSTCPVIVNNSLILGHSNIDDMRMIFGQEFDSFENDENEKITYYYIDSEDESQILSFEADKTTNIITGVLYNNISMNEDVDNSIKSEYDATQLSYSKLPELGNSYVDYRFRLNDSVYSVPLPMAELMADGWIPDDVDEEEILMPKESTFVRMNKDSTEIICEITNINNTPSQIFYNWITSVEASENTLYDNEWFMEEIESESDLDAEDTELIPNINADVVIPGEIKIGMTKNDFISAMQNCKVPFMKEEDGEINSFFLETSEEGELTETETDYDNEYVNSDSEIYEETYAILNQTWNNTYEVTIYTGSDGYYPQDTITSIKIKNNPLGIQ